MNFKVFTAVAFMSFTLMTGCKLAKFGFTGKQGGSGSGTADVKPSPPGDNKNPETSVDPNANGGAPNAALEVEQLGVVTSNVVVNVAAIIRPTLDTIDSDNGLVENCVNNGILKATYTLNGEVKTVSRKAGECSSLAYEYTFKQTGIVNITLEVESDEGETAIASGVVQVIASDTPPGPQQPSLSISANPTIALINQPIKFTASCYTPGMHQVTWNFADGTSEMTGDELSHSFAKKGQFYVKGTCVGGETTMQGGVTVVIQDNTQNPGTSSNPKTSQNPGQNPGQNNPNQK